MRLKKEGAERSSDEKKTEFRRILRGDRGTTDRRCEGNVMQVNHT